MEGKYDESYATSDEGRGVRPGEEETESDYDYLARKERQAQDRRDIIGLIIIFSIFAIYIIAKEVSVWYQLHEVERMLASLEAK